VVDVLLSDIPDKGIDLEHYVAALFQSAGYFVEKNITERDPADVLELDVVASDYSSAQPAQPILVEVKGGGWGWKEVFNLLGRSEYLGIENSALVVKECADCALGAMRSRMESNNLEIVHLDDFERSREIFDEHALGDLRSQLGVWRYSYRIETELVSLINSRPAKQLEGNRAVLHGYHRLVNDGAFFEPDPIEQVHSLSGAFKDHPKLTSDLANELDAERAASGDSVGDGSLHRALYGGTEPLLQASMYVEHRARLALLKFAVDSILGDEEAGGRGGVGWMFRRAQLPVSFNEGLIWLREQPTFWRYPILWQQFMWGYGGFYLEHRKADEFDWMSEYSGVPTGEVPTALEAFDHLFPKNEKWLKARGATDVVLTLMTPWPFQGLGAAFRLAQYELDDGFRSLAGDWFTSRDLACRARNAYRFLGGEDE